MRIRVGLAFSVLLLLAGAAGETLADQTWPREIKTEKGIFTFYQPQPETFSGNTLTGRAALSLTAPSAKAPVFGVLWFTCQVDTDREAGTAVLRNLVVTNVRWPDSKEPKQTEVATFLTTRLSKTDFPISLERLKASLATAEREQASLEGIKNDPPRFIVVEERAELLQYDGEPRAFAIPNTDMEHFVNTPFAVVREKKSGTCYLSGGKIWYSAKDPRGPWTPIANPPADVKKLVPADTSSAPAPATPPKIVVATEPSELISTLGPPQWKPIGKGGLVYIENTETPVVREVASGQVYVLASGRWFRAASLEGPWTFVRGDKLPAAFQDLPPESDLAEARVSIAGTEEAEEALLDAQVPQTAAINRSTAKLEVKYDGEPQFKKIEGTGVEYAVNTSAQVLRIGGKYYACDDAVWFVSGKAEGPWAVADSVPSTEIKKIPPSEPVYNVTHVTVYESTPSVVYVGYTPGYLWSYPYYGVPIYGTGWHYPPYWGPAAYYPRPSPWGFHVSYNPWYGWGFGFTYSTGFMSIGITFGGGYGGYYRPGYGGGYYRPPCYYPPGGYRPVYHPPGYRPPGARPPGYRPPGYAGARPTPYPSGGGGQVATRPAGSDNLYKGAGSKDRVAPTTMQRDAGNAKADRVAKGANNVYGDKQGNVYRQTNSGWQQNTSGGWKAPASGSTNVVKSRPSTGSQAPSNLNRDAAARQQGAYRSSGGTSRSSSGSRGGGARGGGGGRR